MIKELNIDVDSDSSVTEDDVDLDQDISLALRVEAETLVEFDVIQASVNASLVNMSKIEKFVTKAYNESFYNEVASSLSEDLILQEETPSNNVISKREILQRLINEQRGIKTFN